MALYTIGDLHLSLAGDKPMDKFGETWQNHPDKLRQGFSALGEEDLTVLCGDLSWAMSMQEAEADFRFIQELPGKNDFELIDTLAKLSGTKEPYAITDIRTAPVRHKTVVDAEEMPGTVRNFLGI